MWYRYLLSCVAQIKQDGPEEWDYKRTCVEGPIFDSERSAGKDDGTVKMNLHALESELDQA